MPLKRALLVRLGAIGDMVLITPAIKKLKEQGGSRYGGPENLD